MLSCQHVEYESKTLKMPQMLTWPFQAWRCACACTWACGGEGSPKAMTICWQVGRSNGRWGFVQNYFFFFPQNAMVSVKELCGLPPIASLKQCILTLSSRLVNSENAPSVTLCMKDAFPYLEPLGTMPDVQKKVLAAYDLVGASHCHLCLFPWLQKWQASCWFSSSWKFLLNEWSSSGNLNYAKLSFYHPNHNTGVFVVVSIFSFKHGCD